MSNKKKVMKNIIRILFCLGMVILLSNSMKMSLYAQLTGTVSAASANIREEASTSSKVLASVVRNDVVSIAGEIKDTSGTLWYQVHVDSTTKGYIAASLVTKAGDSGPITNVTPNAGTTPTTPTTAPTTTTTTNSVKISPEDQWKAATVIGDSVRVRAEASTSSGTLATVPKGVVVTVTGSKTGTDSKEWYQVSFSVDRKDYLGFIRSDLISFDTEAIENVTQVDGTLDPNASDIDYTEEVTPEPETEATEEPTEKPAKEDKYTVIDTEKRVAIPSGYIEVSIATDLGDVIGWKNGDFYIFYAKNLAGEEGFYRYDSINHVYQRYEESESVNPLENSKKDSNGILLYILIGAVVLLFLITVFLTLRLSDMKADLQYADEEFEETYEEDYVDEEGAYEERRDIRRNQREDIRLVKELEEVLEKELVNKEYKRNAEQPLKKSTTVKKKPTYDDSEEYLKPDDEESWDDEFDFIDID